jgi:GDP-L-fucose synthase
MSIKEIAKLVNHTIEFKRFVTFDISKPKGTLRKLMDVLKLHGKVLKHTTGFSEGNMLSY